MKKLYLISAALLLGASFGHARQLSEEEALQRARSFQSASVGTRAANGDSRLKLAYKASLPASDAPAYYVFNQCTDNGFIVVSGDDSLRPVLGYSDSGSFNLSQMPPNMKWWLSEYENEIRSYLADSPQAAPYAATRAAGWQALTPMIQTEWNQSSPYNYMCPEIGGRRAVTGCVATAMAQVMKKFNHPARGTGSVSYTTKSGIPVSCDFSKITFDWANMLNTYDSGSPKAAKDAVAQLMFACGASVYMNYTAGESRATDVNVSFALRDYFGYDKGVKTIERSQYSLDDWEELIYNEISEGRPVIYGGQANRGGHEFVCDGYSSDGLFHINWGWGGMSDGYFALTALNPHDQGIGSYEGGYNSGQSAVVGIQPDKGNPESIVLRLDGGFESNGNSIFSTTGNLYSLYDKSVTCSLGIMVEPEAGGEPKFFDANSPLSFSPFNKEEGSFGGYGPIQFQAIPTGLSAGSYKVYPAYKSDTTPWTRLRCQYGDQQYVELTVGADGMLTYTNPGREIPFDITMTKFAPQGKIEKGKEAVFDVSVKNNGEVEYSQLITFKVSPVGSQQVVAELPVGGINIGPGATFSGSFKWTLNIDDGKYEVNAYDKVGKNICASPFPITVGEDVPGPAASISVASISRNDFYSNVGCDLAVKFSVSGTESAKLTPTVKLLAKDSDKEVASVRYDEMELGKGDIEMTLKSFKVNCVAGNYDLVVVDGDGKQLGEKIPVAVYGSSDMLWYGISADSSSAYIVAAPTSYEGVNGVIEVPASITQGDKTYSVAEIRAGAFVGCQSTKAFILMPSAVLFKDAKAVFGSDMSSLDIYVDGNMYADYSNLFGNSAKGLYSYIKELRYNNVEGDPTKLKVGSVYKLDVVFVPSENVNTGLTYKATPENAVKVVEGAVENGKKHLNIECLNKGNATLVVSSVQPGATKSFMIPLAIAEADSLVLDKKEASLHIGDSIQLAAKTNLEGDVVWTSSDAKVATVEGGLVKAIAAGTAVITAKVGELTATCSVTVSAVVAESIQLDKTTAELLVGETVTLAATVLPENVTTKDLTWTTSNDKVATVADGVVKAIAPGEATITVSTKDGSDLSATCKVTVIMPELTLDMTSATIYIGETIYIAASTNLPDAITWSSSDENVATVSDGLVKATGMGSATITASCGGLTAQCVITVEIPFEEVKLSADKITLVIGENTVLKATAYPEEAGKGTFIWESSDESVAKVSDDGTVTGISSGKAVITVTLAEDPTLKAECEITVIEASAVDSVIASQMKITSVGTDVVISGLPAGVILEIYDLNGVRHISEKLHDGTATFSLPSKGIYIFKAGTHIMKKNL